MATTSERITAEEFLEYDGDGRFRELIGGEVIVNSPSLRHQVVSWRLAMALGNWVDGAPGRGMAVHTVDTHLTDRDVYVPDLLWFAEAHVAERERSARRLPDLCVEIRSPSTWRYDVGRKWPTYEDAGLPELWMVDLMAASVLVYRRSKPGGPLFDVALELRAEELLTSPQLPGFSLSVASLFPAA